jgi:hypothetical protein
MGSWFFVRRKEIFSSIKKCKISAKFDELAMIGDNSLKYHGNILSGILSIDLDMVFLLKIFNNLSTV